MTLSLTSGMDLNHLTSSGLRVSLELDRLVGHDEVFEVAESRKVARRERSERRRREERDRSGSGEGDGRGERIGTADEERLTDGTEEEGERSEN